jgi:hypothetical protein
VLALVEWVKDTLIWTRIKKLAKNHPFVSTPPQTSPVPIPRSPVGSFSTVDSVCAMSAFALIATDLPNHGNGPSGPLSEVAPCQLDHLVIAVRSLLGFKSGRRTLG